MKTNKKIGLILSAIGILGLVACGGGGGGGGDPIVAPAGLTYAGVTSQAIIDSNNAAELASDAFLGGETGTNLGIFSSVSGPQSSFVREIKLYEAVQVFNGALHQIDFEAQGMESLAVQSEQETMYGDCGGSATYAITLDDVSGAFNGSMNFNSYCNENTTISGAVGFSGQLDLSTSTPSNFNFSISMVSLASNNQSYVMDGAVSFDVTETTSQASMDLLMKDNANETFWIKDYRMSITDGVDYVDMIMSGLFYHPTHGYVDLSTITPVRIYNVYEWPSSGVLQINGGDGTKAQLTAINENNCEIIADADGDDIYEYGPVQMSWNEI